MLKNLVTSALFAGFAAGLVTAALQISFVVPLVLEAELYETGMLIHFADVTAPMPDLEIEHEWMRNGMTVLFTSTIYIGFAFIMVSAMSFAQMRGVSITAQNGVLWGLAGYAAFQLSPAMGLPPELPGMIAAEVAPRQIWWIGTVVATLAGISALVFGKGKLLWGVGAVVLALPHIIGAPHPDTFGGVVPPELAAQFVGKSLGVGAIGWAILGLLSAHFWVQENR